MGDLMLNATSTEAVKRRLDKYFNKIHQKNTQSSIQILIDSKKLDFQYNYSSEELNKPFHIASIGKMLTATLIMILIERNSLSLHDLIANYFTNIELENLFIFKDKDYMKEVTVEQLLAHTSGIGDYFDDPVNLGSPMSKLIVSESDKKWTPYELVEFTRNKQKATGIPGQAFHYSDTGYILLGLIIEKVSGKPFHENLHDEIFTPLGMQDSYMLFYSDPNNPSRKFQKIWFNGTDITDFQSLSVDWSGGGIISTPKDLLSFNKGFREGKLFTEEKIQFMENCNHKFRTGIHYGTGIMEIRFEEFFFLLKGLPRVKGHIGVLSTHLFYDPSTETHIVMNFGSSKLMVQSFKALIEIVSQLKRVKP